MHHHMGPAEPMSQGTVQTQWRTAGCPEQLPTPSKTPGEKQSLLFAAIILFSFLKKESIQSPFEQQDPGLFFSL